MPFDQWESEWSRNYLPICERLLTIEKRLVEKRLAYFNAFLTIESVDEKLLAYF